MKFTSYYSNFVKSLRRSTFECQTAPTSNEHLIFETCMYQLEQLRCEGQSLANKHEVLFQLCPKGLMSVPIIIGIGTIQTPTPKSVQGMFSVSRQ